MSRPYHQSHMIPQPIYNQPYHNTNDPTTKQKNAQICITNNEKSAKTQLQFVSSKFHLIISLFSIESQKNCGKINDFVIH